MGRRSSRLRRSFGVVIGVTLAVFALWLLQLSTRRPLEFHVTRRFLDKGEWTVQLSLTARQTVTITGVVADPPSVRVPVVKQLSVAGVLLEPSQKFVFEIAWYPQEHGQAPPARVKLLVSLEGHDLPVTWSGSLRGE